MLRRSLVGFAALAAALAVVSLSAASQGGHGRAHAYPSRIVSLSPTMTEDLFAIGAGKQVVAVDDQSDWPKSAPHTSLSGYTPNVEAIASYRPDLVVVSYPGPVVGQLQKLGIQVVIEPAVDDLAHAYEELRDLGRLTGHLAQAKKVVRSMEVQLKRTIQSVPKSDRHLTVYHELDQTYYSTTSSTFIGRIYKLFGFRDIADAADTSHTGYPQLSAEYIVAKNPQLIVLADTRCCGQTPATVAARPGWKNIAAVRNHRVVNVDDDVASRWGPRIVQFAKALARIAKQP
ncbi:MAG TPA: ABC transporter substrate-binding protein [Gaiellaceae bacterium]|nr:ABC transporter substrate-binding protein [Gaiellaceae bacterium]